MAKPISFGKIDISFGDDSRARAPTPGAPARILLLGDFSGRASRGATGEIAGRRVHSLERDAFDDVMARLGAEVEITVGKGGARTRVRFSEIEDFHPDRLFERVELFHPLTEMRDALRDPRVLAAAAARKRAAQPRPAAPPPDAPPAKAHLNGKFASALLEDVLENTVAAMQKPRAAEAPTDWAAFLGDALTRHVVPDLDPEQTQVLASIDTAVQSLMRFLLHSPELQALEAAWRAARFLVFRLDEDARVEVALVDVSKAEIAADLAATDNLRATGLAKLLESSAARGGAPWTHIVGTFAFGPTVDDAELLGRLAKLAHAAGATFLAEANPLLLGCESLAWTPSPDEWKRPLEGDAAEAWQALRRLPEASNVGLALPRLLLRLPYGKATSPTERLDFDELGDDGSHARYLWGNPAYAVALLLAGSRRGGAAHEIENLPLHVDRAHGETRVKPPAEVFLTDRAAATILDRGLIPLLAIRSSSSVRVPGFPSIAEPAKPLAAR